MTDVSDEPRARPRERRRSSCLGAGPGRRRWTGTTGAATGSARLPSIVPSLADRWGLTLGPPFQPGGQGSWTAPAATPTGRDLVLKVGLDARRGAHEADGAPALGRPRRGAAARRPRGRGHDARCCWSGRVPASSSAGRCRRRSRTRSSPGCSAGCGCRRRPATRSGRSPRCATCGPTRPRRTPPADWTPGCSGRAGRSCSAACRANRGRTRTCCCSPTCTAATCCPRSGEPWLVIDPKPYVGDRCYDPLQHLFNCLEPGRGRPGRDGAADGRPVRRRPGPLPALVLRPLGGRVGLGRAGVRRPGRGGPRAGSPARSARPGKGTLPRRHRAAATAASRSPSAARCCRSPVSSAPRRPRPPPGAPRAA